LGALKDLNNAEEQRRVTVAAISAAQQLVSSGAVANKHLSELDEDDWGWLVTAAIFGWVKAKAREAVRLGQDVELSLRAVDGDPWDVGAVSSILPKLADQSDIDWSLPLLEWSGGRMEKFLMTAFNLIRQAMSTRDHSNGRITNPREQVEQAVQLANGGAPEIPAFLQR
jgi:hypothetical protein